jgi:hypothetical protein
MFQFMWVAFFGIERGRSFALDRFLEALAYAISLFRRPLAIVTLCNSANEVIVITSNRVLVEAVAFCLLNLTKLELSKEHKVFSDSTIKPTACKVIVENLRQP